MRVATGALARHLRFMNEVIDKLLQAPDLPEQVETLTKLLAAERERRLKFYEEITEEQKVEFINGQVVFQSPAKVRHIAVSDRLFHLLTAHVHRHKLGVVMHEKALCTFPRNDYEPDVLFFGRAKAHSLKPDQMQLPVPDFIAEVLSPTTEKRDRGVKFADYALHEVREYWIIDPGAETLEKHLLKDRAYTKAPKQRRGEIASEVVTGFRIPLLALFDDDACHAALKRLLA